MEGSVMMTPPPILCVSALPVAGAGQVAGLFSLRVTGGRGPTRSRCPGGHFSVDGAAVGFCQDGQNVAGGRRLQLTGPASGFVVLSSSPNPLPSCCVFDLHLLEGERPRGERRVDQYPLGTQPSATHRLRVPLEWSQVRCTGGSLPQTGSQAS